MDKKNGRGGVLPPRFRRPANTSALVANTVIVFEKEGESGKFP